MNKITYVLDTNVLLHDPESLTKFPNHNVVVPVTVLEELDKMKRLPSDLGRNSRIVFRMLDSFSTLGKGDLHHGVLLDSGSTIRIQLEIKTDYHYNFALSVNDKTYRIIMAAYFLHEKGDQVIFVSKDFAARIKAEAIGLRAQDYQNLRYSYEAIYKGIRKIETSKHDVDVFYKDGELVLPKLDCRPNEYCIVTSPEHSSAVGKYDSQRQAIEPLLKTPNIWGIKPRNVEQRCAIDVLLRDEIKLVTLVGQAGTGKTLLALACGMRKVFDEGLYSRILVSRPVIPLGRDIGYLPGLKRGEIVQLDAADL